mgnify:CR=1 FL=1
MNKRYNFADVIKFLFAGLIIMSHYASEWGSFNKKIDMFFSLYIVVVPFFFVSSSFFVFRKFNSVQNKEERKSIIIKYIKRIAVMYLSWSCIYILFNVLTWCVYGVKLSEIAAYVHELVVYSSYNTIWFLPATAIGVAMVYLFSRYLSIRQMIAVALIFYIIGCIGHSYNFVLDRFFVLGKIYEIYNNIFLTTRNGVFNGFPFAAIGYVIALNSKDENKGFYNKNLILSGIFLLAFVFEAVFIKKFFSAINANTILFLFPFSYYFYKWVLGIELKDRKIFLTFRKLSTVMFLSQRIFLTALPVLLPESFFRNILINNSYIGLIYILSITILFSFILVKLSKYKLIKLFV